MDTSKFPVLAASAEGRELIPTLVRIALDRFEPREGGPLPAGKPNVILGQTSQALGPMILPEQGVGSEEALSLLGEIISQGEIDLAHPRASAHLQPPVISTAVAADALASMTNASLDTFDSGPASIAVEQWVIGVLAHITGLAPSTVGIMTPGGSMSNLLALMCARDRAASLHGLDARWDGAKVLGRPVILCSSAAHFSIQRAAAALGLGESAVVQVPTDAKWRMDVAELRRLIVQHLPDDTIVGVVATAGTTDFGSFDPIVEIRDVCNNFGLWLHVDAAYGFGSLFSDRLSGLATGIDTADSITLDLHKLGWVPAAASALLMPNEAQFQSLERYPDYLYPEDEVAMGYVGTLGMSLQTTRRADALKVAATMLACGRSGLARMVDKCHMLAKHVEERVKVCDKLELVFPVNLTTVGFRYLCDNSDLVNAEIRSQLLASGEALIARTKVNNQLCLKLTVLNPHSTPQDMDEILDLVIAQGRRVEQRRHARFLYRGGAA